MSTARLFRRMAKPSAFSGCSEKNSFLSPESAIGGPERVVAELPFFQCGQHQAFYCLSSAWLPDGKSAILPGLNKLSVETGEMKPLTTPQAGQFDRDPALSPDGRTLAFVRGATFPNEIYLAGLDSEAKVKGP